MTETTTHAECSPSQLKRVILCPGSRRLKRKIYKLSGEEKSSEYAIEGEMLHTVTEADISYKYPSLLKLDIHPKKGLERFHKLNKLTTPLTREQRTSVAECVEYFESVIRELELTSIIESVVLEGRTSLESCGLPETSGRVDVRIISENRLDIIDWKFGQGVPVSSIENPQLMAYAAGSPPTLKDLNEIPEVNLHVVQPRLNSFSPWKTSGPELVDWIENTIMPAIHLSREKDALCIPGIEQCRWCVGVKCAARAEAVNQTATEIFEDYATAHLRNDFIDPTKLAHWLGKAKEVDMFIKELAAVAFDKCLSGEGFPGFKVVLGRSTRGWRDAEDAQSWLVEQAEESVYDFEFEDLFITKFISVAQAEKLHKDLKKSDVFKALWFKPPGKPVLASETDPREAFVSSAQAAFKEFVNGEK